MTLALVAQVALACDTPHEALQIPPSVTAIVCEGHPGFFVPSAKYRELRLQPALALEVAALRRALDAQTATSSATAELADAWRTDWERERTARLSEEGRIPSGLWWALGGAAVAVVVGAVATVAWAGR